MNKNFLLTGLLVSNIALANTDFITKSLTFHYGEYDKSKHTEKVAVVNWNSKEGMTRFKDSEYKGDFFRLAHHFKPQSNPASCGQATGTIVLSAVYEMHKKPFPVLEEWPITIGDKKYPLQYRLWNQENFFNEKTDKILDKRAISMKITKSNGEFGGGMDIEDLQKMLSLHGLHSKLVNVTKSDEKALNEFRKTLENILNSDKHFLILNYDHSYKGLMGGHFSPVVAYESKSDSVLLLDVAAHRNPWIWVNLKDIVSAMNTKNYAQTSNRGYLIVDTKL
jgi:hypothetical protein